MSEQPRKQPEQPGITKKAEQSSTMCLLTLIYHEEYELAVLGILQRGMTVARYTKIPNVQGARTDMLVETDYAPVGRNQLMLVIAERALIRKIVAELRQLRQTEHHGVRGYVTPIEEVI